MLTLGWYGVRCSLIRITKLKTKTMTNKELYLTIAESGNEDVIKRSIYSLEKEKRISGFLSKEDEASLIMLKNSLKWVKPFDLFGVFGFTKPV